MKKEYEEEIKNAEDMFIDGDYKGALRLLLNLDNDGKYITRLFPLISEIENDYCNDLISVVAKMYKLEIAKGNEKIKAMLFWMRGKIDIVMKNLMNAKQNLEIARSKAEGVLSKQELTKLNADLHYAQVEVQKIIDPEKASEFITQGNILQEEKNYQGAIDLFTQSLKYKATSEAYFERAMCWDSLKFYNKAIEDLKSSLKTSNLEQNDREHMFMYYIGIMYTKLWRYKEAVSVFSEANELYESTNRDNIGYHALIKGSLYRAEKMLQVNIIINH